MTFRYKLGKTFTLTGFHAETTLDNDGHGYASMADAGYDQEGRNWRNQIFRLSGGNARGWALQTGK
jgi:hypothetical protein